MRKVDVAIVGAGPAGLSAAIEAARAGLHVVVADENPKPGGQLVKQTHKFFGSRHHFAGLRGFQIAEHLAAEAQAAGAELLLDSVVWGVFRYHELGVTDFAEKRTHRLQAIKVIFATGAAERVLVFPGWTLPGVMGAGAAQTIMNVHRVLPGRRVLMVGAGNVGVIVSYQLIQAGAEVCAIVEAQSEIGGYRVHADRLRRLGVPILTSHTIVAAHGASAVEGATVAEVDPSLQCVPGTEKHYEVDTICLAVGLRPLAELPRIAGCECTYLSALGGHVPLHTADMETSQPGIYVAGDAAGIEEATVAMEEGRLAALAAAEELGRLSSGEFLARKREILDRLAMLRSGPSGAELGAAKQRLYHRIAQVIA